MKIVAMSDTHDKHHRVKNIPNGDVLVHAGDMTINGELNILRDFAKWMSRQPHGHKIVIAGNHDFCFEGPKKEVALEILDSHGIIYLEEDSVEIDGVKFYGSPRSNTFEQYVFTSENHEWSIPDDTDVLITHGPPYGIQDALQGYGKIGCQDLRELVEEVELKAHIFGHVHEQFGEDENFDNHFNVSLTGTNYSIVHEPLVVEVES